MRIAVVDDEPLLLRILALTLKCSYPCANVEVFSSGAAALSRMVECRFDLVILDLQMPETDGVETAKCLRNVAPDLPIMFMSADVDSELAMRARHVPRTCVLDKITLHFTLDEVVGRMLARRT